MTQPSASRAIAGYETQIGLPLVRRTPTGSKLTREGQLVVEWAQPILSAAQRLRDSVNDLGNVNSSRISIAASMTVAEYLAPHWLRRFKDAHPNAKVSFAVRNSQDVFEGVRQGEYDVGLVESPEPAAKLQETVVGHDRLTVVVDPTHPWANRKNALTIAELANTPLIVREEGSGTRVTLDEFLAPYCPVAPSLELNSNAAVRITAQSGMGPAVLSYLVVQDALRAGDLVAIPVSGLNIMRNFRAVWDGSQRLSGVRAAFVEVAMTNAEMPSLVQKPRPQTSLVDSP
nr:LysR substrate-binding domain-containing protein [Paeniglutamicibacter psychrophenolicus]